MCALKLLSDTVPRVTDKTFKRKFVALGKLLARWEDIMGEQMAAQAQPLKIRYRKPKRKGDRPEATLDIAASSAHASLLVMQKGMLLEKINYIFGEALVTDIRFIHTQVKSPSTAPKHQQTLSDDEKNSLSDMLESIEDEDIRSRLMNMGAALIADHKKQDK